MIIVTIPSWCETQFPRLYRRLRNLIPAVRSNPGTRVRCPEYWRLTPDQANELDACGFEAFYVQRMNENRRRFRRFHRNSRIFRNFHSIRADLQNGVDRDSIQNVGSSTIAGFGGPTFRRLLDATKNRIRFNTVVGLKHDTWEQTGQACDPTLEVVRPIFEVVRPPTSAGHYAAGSPPTPTSPGDNTVCDLGVFQPWPDEALTNQPAVTQNTVPLSVSPPDLPETAGSFYAIPGQIVCEPTNSDFWNRQRWAVNSTYWPISGTT